MNVYKIKKACIYHVSIFVLLQKAFKRESTILDMIRMVYEQINM